MNTPAHPGPRRQPPHPHRHKPLRRALARLWPVTLAASLAGCALPPVPATVEHDPQRPTLTANGYRFHAQVFGPAGAPVLIVLHGGPGMDHRYLLGLQALADHWRVVFYDQRSSGLSPRVPADSITVESFIADLDAIVDQVSPGRPVHLLGHSWGAMLAAAYTGTHPTKVDRLVLAEPGFLDGSQLDGMDLGGWPGWPVIRGFARAWIGQWFMDTRGDPYARDDAFLLHVLPLTQGADELCDGRLPPLQAWRAGHPAFAATLGRAMKDRAWARSLDFRRGTEAFDGATLLLSGACNRSVSDARRRDDLRSFRHGQWVVLPQAGHFLFNDQPQASVALVRRFLASERATDKLAEARP
ncbi:alpha/beta fold hydrolase [Pseudaquabacterium rugosum]|uniref:Alpha/beta hydrolase n=1 Tax=Pseudaquabacterium rugosum TaxID=2984194 RepID=A0ABU9BE06_9BURK